MTKSGQQVRNIKFYNLYVNIRKYSQNQISKNKTWKLNTMSYTYDFSILKTIFKMYSLTFPIKLWKNPELILCRINIVFFDINIVCVVSLTATIM